MRNLLFVTAVSVMISPIAATPAFAGDTVSMPQQTARNTLDPNEVVCEKQEDTGSRLSSSKICMTRSQWAEQRRLNRQDIEKMQTQRPCAGEGGSC